MANPPVDRSIRELILNAMSELELLERKIQKLPARELARFRAWFNEFDWDEWDRQLKRDIKAGKLDSLARKARQDHAAGRTKPL